jgi:hypothetical protein
MISMSFEHLKNIKNSPDIGEKLADQLDHQHEDDDHPHQGEHLPCSSFPACFKTAFNTEITMPMAAILKIKSKFKVFKTLPPP